MKPQSLFLLTLFIAAFCCFSCEKMPTADTTEIPTDTTEIIIPEIYPKVIETIDYFLLDTTNSWIRPLWNDLVEYSVERTSYSYLYPVNSQTELSTILQDKQNLPVIDFDKYTLMRLHTDWSTENNVTYSYIQTGEKTYTVDVEITGLPSLLIPNLTPQFSFVLTNFLVPKLPEDAVFELNVTRNINLDGARVVRHFIDVEAIVVKHCYDVYAITDSFSLGIIDYGGVFAYNHVPKEYQIDGLPVIVSGKVYDHSGLNRCLPYEPDPYIIIELNFARMFHIDSIKPKLVEP